MGNADRARLDLYLDSIREVERQIERAEAAAEDNPTPDLDRPVGVPESFADHAKLMFDLQLLAFQADITRVITFQLTRELTNRTYPEVGVPDHIIPRSSRQRPGKACEDRQDQCVPCVALLRFRSEAQDDARR